MERLKHNWKRTPRHIRRPLVVVVGGLLIVLSALIGWIPGPGGMIPFLLGIAVLATEFTWAERLRDWILRILSHIGRLIRSYPVLSGVIGLIALGALAYIAYVFYNYVM